MLLTQNNTFYQKIHTETQNMTLYLDKSIEEFHNLFKKNFTSFDDALNYLKETSIPNKYVCSQVIQTIPGWTCVECSKYTDSIFCHDCYKRFKNLHKDHHLYFLSGSTGMCGCGEPEAMYKFCPEHSGPHTEQKKINEFISKAFTDDILENLKLFFNEFFQKFSNYFILTEKCQYFCPSIFKQTFEDINEDSQNNLNDEKQDILMLKENFGILYQKFFDFIRLICENNLAMLYLIANYFLENHFKNQNLEEDYKTYHRCIKFDTKDIKVINNEKEYHKCQCPFFVLLFSNWRDNITDDENQTLLLSFTSNFPLKHAFGVIYFSIYIKILLNNNSMVISNRIQFILDYTTAMLITKTTLIEETYEIFYQNFYKTISKGFKDEDGKIKNLIINELEEKAGILEKDCELYSMPITLKLMYEKIYIMTKRIIDCICLIHNENKFLSIFPHPIFQKRGCSTDLIDLELELLSNIECLNMITQWGKIEITKEIFKYIINKIINQEKEGINQLKKDEYSFHLGLYRCFGLMINFFCFDYSFNNNCSLYESIQFFKNNFFDSKNQVEILVDIILNDYFKFFGFISGIKNRFFNYYDSMIYYSIAYLQNETLLKIDFTLLKYMFILYDKNINIDTYLKMGNVENIYSFFEKIFILNNDDKNEKYKTNNINFNNFENNLNNNISSDELLDTLNNSYDIFPPSIDYGNNLQVIRALQNQFNTRINPNIIQQFINENNENELFKQNEINRDKYNNLMHIKFLLELLLIFMKDDSCIFWSLMRFYKNTSSTKTKGELFDVLKKNKSAMEDLKNILKEKIVKEIVARGNLSGINKIKNNIDKYFFDIFDEDNFNKILDELTMNKMNGEIKMYYSYLMTNPL